MTKPKAKSKAKPKAKSKAKPKAKSKAKKFTPQPGFRPALPEEVTGNWGDWEDGFKPAE